MGTGQADAKVLALCSPPAKEDSDSDNGAKGSLNCNLFK
jgi:hypothetical protein